MKKVIPKKPESKYVSALPKILNGPSLLTCRSATSSIIFGPFRLLGNAHLFSWLFRWPVGVDMWCRSSEVRIRQWVREKIRRISNLLKSFKVRTLSNSNANFVTSLVTSDKRTRLLNELCMLLICCNKLQQQDSLWHASLHWCVRVAEAAYWYNIVIAQKWTESSAVVNMKHTTWTVLAAFGWTYSCRYITNARSDMASKSTHRAESIYLSVISIKKWMHHHI